MAEHKPDTNAEVAKALAALKRLATKRTLDGMARYAIPSDNALGVAMRDIQTVAKRLRKDLGDRAHDLADPLWDTGVYEARTLVAYIADPARVTGAQMDRWRSEFDSWAICDTLCFALFDRTPLAWKKVAAWSKPQSARARAHPNDESRKRAPLALIASLAGHDKTATEKQFLAALRLAEAAVAKPPDDRNFVTKGASWAIRCIGRRSAALHAAALKTAERLAASPHAGARWVGKDALRDLNKPAVMRKFANSGEQSRGRKSPGRRGNPHQGQVWSRSATCLRRLGAPG